MKKRSTLTACVIATLGTSIAIAPATVAMAAPAPTSSSSTAAIGNGFRLTSSTDYERGKDLTITGTGARAHQNVSLWVDGNLELSVAADEEGDWEFTVPGEFTTVDSLTYEFRSGLQNPFTETFTAADGPVLGGFKLTSGTTYERGEDLVITGRGAAPHQNVSMWAGGNLALSVAAGAEGEWTFTVPGRLTTADSLTYEFRTGYNKSFTQQFTAEDGQIIPSFALTSGTTYERGEDLVITGKGASAHRDVTLWAGKNPAFSGQADEDGNWQVTVPGRVTGADELEFEFRSNLQESFTQKFTASDGIVTPHITITSATEYERGQAFTIAGTTTQQVTAIQVRAGSDIPFSPLVDAEGNWSFTIPAGAPILDEDSFDFRFVAGDKSLEQTFTAADGLITPKITITSATEYEPGEQFTVTGTTTRRVNSILVRSEGKVIGGPVVNEAGEWSFTTPEEFTGVDEDSFDLTFVAGKDELTETFTAADGESESPLRVTSPTDYVKGQKITVTGKNTPNQKVELRDTKGALLRTITTNTTGDWTFTTGGTYTADTVTWTLTSGTHEMTHTITAKAESPLRVTSPTDYVKGQKITVTGTNTPNQKINLLDTKGALLRQIPTGNDGTWSFTTGGTYTADTVTWTLTSGTHQTTHTITGK
ncbi:Ig-like domain-containing protein [Curtobacterium sp. USHLN213]|uniref:Ig-like domain-containing protein n=1 Tax=Curtobacterium sp. USHLN213 TaxID=3081255 RepID=UPI0030176435